MAPLPHTGGGETPPRSYSGFDPDQYVPRLIRLETEDGIGPRFPRRFFIGVLAFITLIALVAIWGIPRSWLPGTVSGTGWIEASASSNIRAPVQGRISQVFVVPGQRVGAGQPLVQMDGQPFREQLVDLEHELRILHLDERRAAEARNLARDNNTLEHQAAELDLIDARNVLLRQSFAFLNKTVDVDSLLGAHVHGVHIGIDAAVNGVLRSQARLDALTLEEEGLASSRLDSLRTVEAILQLEGRREALQRRLETLLLKAPTEGVVQDFEPGQLLGRWVGEGEAVLEVADSDSWQARLFVPASRVFRVQTGDSARLTVGALSEIWNEPLIGVVDEVGLRPSEQEGVGGRFLVTVTLVSPTNDTVFGALRSGFSAKGDVLTGPVSPLSLINGWFRKRMAGAP